MAVRNGQRRHSRGPVGLLLAGALAVLGAGAVPMVLCQAPGGHLAVEPAWVGCASAAGVDADAAGGCDACGMEASDHDCSDSLLALCAVLRSGETRIVPGVAPAAATLPALVVAAAPVPFEARGGPDLFSPSRSRVLRA